MIKAALFDYGGVITSGGAGNELAERLAVNLGITTEQAADYIYPQFNDYIKSEINEKELWERIERQYGHPISTGNRDIWNKWDSMIVIPEMNRLVADLKAKGIIVGVLSNVIPNTENAIRLNGGYDGFDFTVLSCDMGKAKPDPKLYKIAINEVQKRIPSIKTNEIVFIDDQDINLNPARKLGLRTVLAKNSEDTIAEIKELIKV